MTISSHPARGRGAFCNISLTEFEKQINASIDVFLLKDNKPFKFVDKLEKRMRGLR